MNQRGRKSAAALAVVPDQPGVPALAVPPGLTQAERNVWLATVNSQPADHFGIEHVPILVEYARHVCRSHVIDEQLKGFDPEWLATDEGVRRYEKLSGVAIKTAGMIQRLATTMRLTHQSRYRADKVIPKPGRKLWQREPSQS
jgi:hypothetical protein